MSKTYKNLNTYFNIIYAIPVLHSALLLPHIQHIYYYLEKLNMLSDRKMLLSNNIHIIYMKCLPCGSPPAWWSASGPEKGWFFVMFWQILLCHLQATSRPVDSTGMCLSESNQQMRSSGKPTKTLEIKTLQRQKQTITRETTRKEGTSYFTCENIRIISYTYTQIYINFKLLCTPSLKKTSKMWSELC